MQVTPQWVPPEDSTVRVICKLHNQQPLPLNSNLAMAEWSVSHPLNPEWNNWGQDPSFVVVLLKLHAHLTSSQRILDRWPVGAELNIALDLQQYNNTVTIFTPGEDPTSRAIEKLEAVQSDPQSPVINATFGGDATPSRTTTGTTTSGIYDVVTQRTDGAYEDSRYALNVNAREGDTARIEKEQLIASLEPIAVRLSDLDAFQGSASQNVGGTASFWLMMILLAGLVGEQFLAYLLSYHTPKGGGVAT